MKRRTVINVTLVVLIAFFSFLLFTNSALAETKTFIKEYTYQAGDEDSKNSSRTISLREVKRLLLEELGTYLESITEVQNFQLTKDQITTLTAGIVQTELIEEKWNTEDLKYWLKAKITADSSEVIKAIDTLRKDRQKTKELEEIRKRSDDLLKENERLRQELATAKGTKKKKGIAAYNKIKDLNAAEWFEKGNAAEIAGNNNQAIKNFNKAIELSPQYSRAYCGRGVAYAKLGNFNQATKDFDKAIELNPQYAMAYSDRGNAYGDLGNFKQAIKDHDKAIELDPQLAMAYSNRGNTYGMLGNYKQAIADYDHAIKLNPQDADFYYNRGVAYGRLGNTNGEIKNYKIAALLGDEKAQAFLRKQGIDW